MKHHVCARPAGCTRRVRALASPGPGRDPVAHVMTETTIVEVDILLQSASSVASTTPGMPRPIPAPRPAGGSSATGRGLATPAPGTGAGMAETTTVGVDICCRRRPHPRTKRDAVSAPTRRCPSETRRTGTCHDAPAVRWARHGRNGSCRKQISFIVLHLNDWPRGWRLKANFWRQQASFRNRPVAPRPAA